mgnify:CR=1 FL=1
MHLKKEIEHCLEKYPESRNDDVYLTSALWWEFHSKSLIESGKAKMIDGDLFINLRAIQTLPREDHIKRIRAKIQNEEFRFTPTNPEVIKLREASRRKWKAKMNNDKYNLYG